MGRFSLVRKIAKRLIPVAKEAHKQLHYLDRISAPTVKVLYLDIDEVIQTTRAHITTGLMIDHQAVKLIDKLCERYNLRIVVSSTWRSHMDDGLTAAKMLEAFGFSPRRLYYKAKDDQCFKTGRSETRGHEILEHLESHPEISEYIVVDDSFSDLDLVKDRLIHVDPVEGFGVRNYFQGEWLMEGGNLDGRGMPFRPQGCVRDVPTWLERLEAEEQEKA